MEADCDAEDHIIFGCDWLRAHDLACLDDSVEFFLCAERGCTSGRPDPTLNVLASPSRRLSPPPPPPALSWAPSASARSLGLPCRESARPTRSSMRGVVRRAPRTPPRSRSRGSRTGRGATAA